MSAAEVLGAVLRMNLAAGVAILGVIALRKLFRPRFGARLAYGLWLLPVLAGAAALSPARQVVIVRSAARFASATGVHAALLAAAIRVGTARNDRHSLSVDHTNTLKWSSVLLLGLITQIALALVHLERPRAMLAALTVFSTGAVVALGLIALQEYPFEGAFRISPAPLERLLALSEAGPNSALPSPNEKAAPSGK